MFCNLFCSNRKPIEDEARFSKEIVPCCICRALLTLSELSRVGLIPSSQRWRRQSLSDLPKMREWWLHTLPLPLASCRWLCPYGLGSWAGDSYIQDYPPSLKPGLAPVLSGICHGLRHSAGGGCMTWEVTDSDSVTLTKEFPQEIQA